MASTPTQLPAGEATGWLPIGPSVLFLYGSGTALVEYTTEASPTPVWMCGEEVALGRPFPVDAPSGGCFIRITNRSDALAAFAIVEDLRR